MCSACTVRSEVVAESQGIIPLEGPVGPASGAARRCDAPTSRVAPRELPQSVCFWWRAEHSELRSPPDRVANPPLLLPRRPVVGDQEYLLCGRRAAERDSICRPSGFGHLACCANSGRSQLEHGAVRRITRARSRRPPPRPRSADRRTWRTASAARPLSGSRRRGRPRHEPEPCQAE